MQLFCIRDWNNKKHYFTARGLYKRIMRDSRSNYNWIASATELVKVCERSDFPKKYALEIELAILNCFANLETKRHLDSMQDSHDADSVDYCYRAISIANDPKDPRIIAVKQKYLKAIIAGVVQYKHPIGNSFRNVPNYGPAYRKICEEWQKQRLEEYQDVYLASSAILRIALSEDFEQTIKAAEEKGIFEKEQNDRLNRIISYDWIPPDHIL